MPGELVTLTSTEASGWARHPRHAGYPMLVHALAHGRVVASTLADDGDRFSLVLPDLDTRAVLVMLGETDEYLSHSAQRDLGPRRLLTVEELIGTPTRRPWVNGACHLDGQAAGLHPETIIDLLCRDYLGRPAGPVITVQGIAQLQSGGHDATRRMLLDAGEFRHRRIYADAAPGAIFSQALIMAVASRDFVDALRVTEITKVSAPALLALDGEAFVTQAYRQILRKEPDRPGLQHYTRELAAGTRKTAILRHLAGELEAVSAGIDLVDVPEEI